MKKKYCSRQTYAGSGQDPVCRPGRRAVLLVSLLLVLTMTVGGTIAFLAARTEQKTNTFAPSRVASQVIEEHFDGEVKSNAAVRNTGDHHRLYPRGGEHHLDAGYGRGQSDHHGLEPPGGRGLHHFLSRRYRLAPGR